MKSNFLVAFLFFTFSQVYSQIKSVTYDLRYNATTNQYDAYVLILDGEAHKVNERIQFNAQLSIIAPSNSSFSMVKSYLPLVSNNNYKGTKSISWEVTNYMENVKALDNKSIYSLAPKLNKTGFYNDIKDGDEIKLFSIEVSPMPVNKGEVRLFSNATDAKSSALEGNNFSNGFTIGGVRQLYNEIEVINATSQAISKSFTSNVYPNPAVNHINVDINSTGEEKVKISIVDFSGKEVLNSEFEKPTSGLMTKYLPLNVIPGIYSMKIELEGQSQEHKVVVVGQL